MYARRPMSSGVTPRRPGFGTAFLPNLAGVTPLVAGMRRVSIGAGEGKARKLPPPETTKDIEDAMFYSDDDSPAPKQSGSKRSKKGPKSATADNDDMEVGEQRTKPRNTMRDLQRLAMDGSSSKRTPVVLSLPPSSRSPSRSRSPSPEPARKPAVEKKKTGASKSNAVDGDNESSDNESSEDEESAGFTDNSEAESEDESEAESEDESEAGSEAENEAGSEKKAPKPTKAISAEHQKLLKEYAERMAVLEASKPTAAAGKAAAGKADSPDVQAKRDASTKAESRYAEKNAELTAARKAVRAAERTSQELQDQLASKEESRLAQEQVVAFKRGEAPPGTESLKELEKAAETAKETFTRDNGLFIALKKTTKAESARLKILVDTLTLNKNLAAEALKQALDGEANPSDARKGAADAYKEAVRLEKEYLKAQQQQLKEMEKADDKAAKDEAKAKKKAAADKKHECFYTKCAIHLLREEFVNFTDKCDYAIGVLDQYGDCVGPKDEESSIPAADVAWFKELVAYITKCQEGLVARTKADPSFWRNRNHNKMVEECGGSFHDPNGNALNDPEVVSDEDEAEYQEGDKNWVDNDDEQPEVDKDMPATLLPAEYAANLRTGPGGQRNEQTDRNENRAAVDAVRNGEVLKGMRKNFQGMIEPDAFDDKSAKSNSDPTVLIPKRKPKP